MITHQSPQTIGRLRVSTADQNPEKNKADILAFANAQNLGQVEFIEERFSERLQGENAKLLGYWRSSKRMIR